MILGMRQQMNGASPSVLALFLSDPADYETLSTLSSMPTGGSISRAGNAMYYDSTGKLTWAPNNICVQGANVTSSPWTNFGGFTRTANVSDPFGGTGAQTITNTGSASGFYQAVSAPVGVKVLNTIWMRKRTGTGAVTLFDADNVTSTAITLSGTWTQYKSTPKAVTSGSPLFYLQMSDPTGAIDIYMPVSAAVTYETTPRAADQVITTNAAYFGPRFDTDPQTLQAKGLLLEGARTNLAPAFSGWSLANCSFTGTTTIGPDGTAVTPLTVATTAATRLSVQLNGTGSASGNTYSVYAKKGSGATDLGRFAIYNATTAATILSADVNYDTGAITYFTGSSGVSTQNVGNGWWRVYLSIAVGISAGDNLIIYAGAVGGSATAGAYAYFYGAQLEAGLFASSLIPNPASTGTITRPAETLTLTGYANRLVEAYWLDQQTGVASRFPETVVSSGAVTINPPTFGWVTSLRAYTNAYAGDITTPSWIDNSGTTGNRMVTDSTGTLTWAPANLITYSNTFSDATWTKASATVSSGITDPFDGTDAWTLTATGNGAQIIKYASTTAQCISSLWIRRRTGSGLVYITGPNGSNTALSVSSTWQRFNAAASPSGGTTAYIGVVLGTSGDAVDIYGAQLEAVTYQTRPRAYIPTTDAAKFLPRYDFDASTTPATPRGMLIEETRTNLLTYSQDFADASWNDFRSSSLSAASFVAPDASSARALVEAAATATHFVQRVTSVAISNATAYTVSIYAKANGRTFLQIMADAALGNLGGVTTFNLSTGAVTLLGNLVTSASIVSVGNGWYRCSITATSTGTSARPGIGISDNATVSNSAFKSYAGDGASGILIFGMMIEAGAFATSYIPTTTGSSIRVSDVVKLSGTALTTLQGASFSALLENQMLAATNGRVLLSYGANAAVFAITNNTIVNNYDSLSVPTSVTATAGSGGLTSVNRIGGGYDASTRTLVFNNGTVATTNAKGTAVAAANIGAMTNAGSIASGWYRSMALYNTRLPDATLKQKSAVGAAY